MDPAYSFVKSFPRPFVQRREQLRQVHEQGGVELGGASVLSSRYVRQTPIGPVLDDGVAAPLRVAKNETVDAGSAARLQDLKSLTTQWMERMGDGGPSQTEGRVMCSLR